MRTAWEMFRETIKGWLEAKAPRMGAALSYYTIFSITPLLVLVMTLTGYFFGEEAIESEIFENISAMVGSAAGDSLREMISSARQPTHGIWGSVLAGVTLIFG